MLERTHTRWQAVTRAFEQRWILRRPRRPGPPRFLVAHNLLLGDTIMLTPLLAKLRANHPQAEIVLLAAPASVPLYSGRPYGVRALPFKPAHWASTDALWGEGPFDLAVVAGDNRYSWLAAAMGARHIVAHAGDHPWTKDWFVDEQRPYPDHPAAWGDMAAELVDGREPPPFRREDWPAPQAEAFEPPAGRYAVLHVGASTPLKQWPAERWRELAENLAARGVEPVWSAGRGQEPLVAACDARGRWRSFAGRLDLPQLWHLLRGAALLVAPDTGVAHLGRASWTPTVTLFGPGSDVICGPGRFWRDTPWRSVTVADFPCRDQPILFRREVAWVRRCQRSLTECAEPRCMQAIGLPAVLAALEDLLAARRAEAT
ncbi:MAG TPA: glycosyltransferase family 9 protein [Usitatibacter sp.]|nr:glycosyltransferase family 9 protein [Usitatibacter sp.]